MTNYQSIINYQFSIFNQFSITNFQNFPPKDFDDELNPKFEIRNKFQIRNSNVPNIWNLENLNFDIVSNFVLRASSLTIFHSDSERREKSNVLTYEVRRLRKSIY